MGKVVCFLGFPLLQTGLFLFACCGQNRNLSGLPKFEACLSQLNKAAHQFLLFPVIGLQVFCKYQLVISPGHLATERPVRKLQFGIAQHNGFLQGCPPHFGSTGPVECF